MTPGDAGHASPERSRFALPKLTLEAPYSGGPALHRR
jgi:hypothetical protein